MKLLKEPLVHFLLIGVALFVLFDVVGSEDAAYDSKVIVVDRDALLTFVQFRTRAFEPRVAAERLDALTPAELERMIDDYVREEALHREALALGMDENDYVIKRRLIQSIEFITNGFVTAATEVSEADLEEYFEANASNYYIAPYATFTHVYFNADNRSREEATSLADAKLAELNEQRVQFSDAPRHGERFPYFVNYVEREPTFVASHFGEPMAEAVFELEPGDRWHGPFQSAYGVHLVMLTRKQEGRLPELDEVVESVRVDAEREAVDEQQDRAIRAIVDTYEVRRDLVAPAEATESP
ncbi:MAG: peptidylprolyl isomerase [Woeseiaceae bacterium]|nr:peptidylprolyl isomerase [Woeseiaceae bacterium]